MPARNTGLRGFFGRLWGGDPPRQSKPEPTPQGKFGYGPRGAGVVSFSGGATHGYGSAQATEDVVGGKPKLLGSFAHTQYELEELVAESQRLFRDNTIYRAIIRRLADVIVGDGLEFQARTENERTNAEIELQADEFWKSPEIRGLLGGVEFQRQLIIQKLVDGRILLRWDAQAGRVQVIGGDRLHSDRVAVSSTKRIEHGVEVDDFQRPVAYWIGQWDSSGTSLKTSKPFPAGEFHYDAWLERFDQVAAPPPLQAIFPCLHRLNDIFDSEAASWQLLSRYAVAIYTDTGSVSQWGQPETVEQTAITDRVVDTPYATMFTGRTNEKIEAVKRDVPGANFDATVRAMLRICGMEIGLSLEFFLLDWSQTNYSSGRASARQVWRHAMPWQAALKRSLSWIHGEWIKTQITRDKLNDRPDITAHEWIADPFEPLDPDKENTADAGAVTAGFKTNTRVLKERRIELSEHLTERAKELAAAADAVAKHNEKYPDTPVTIAHFLGGVDLPVAALTAGLPDPANPSDPSEPTDPEPAPQPEATDDQSA